MEVEGRPLLEVLEEMRKPTLRLTFMRLGTPPAQEHAAPIEEGEEAVSAASAAAAAPVVPPRPDGTLAAGTRLKVAWLYKQGHLVKNWKRRYFELVADEDGGATLKYYGGEQHGSQCVHA